MQICNWHPGVKSSNPLIMQGLMIGHLPSFKIELESVLPVFNAVHIFDLQIMLFAPENTADRVVAQDCS